MILKGSYHNVDYRYVAYHYKKVIYVASSIAFSQVSVQAPDIYLISSAKTVNSHASVKRCLQLSPQAL